MTRQAYLCAAVAAAACAATPASAQEYVKAKSAVDEVNRSFFGICPNLISGGYAIDDKVVTEHGYAQPQTDHDSQGNTIETVAATFPDGKVTLGRIKGKVCSVMVTGPSPVDVINSVHKLMEVMPIDFSFEGDQQPEHGENWVGVPKVPGDILYHLEINAKPDATPPSMTLVLYFTDRK